MSSKPMGLEAAHKGRSFLIKKENMITLNKADFKDIYKK
jgi:hypothetical protein